MSPMGLSHVRLLVLAAGLLWSLAPAADEPPRIATVDWTIASTLLAMDVTPAGVAQTDAYEAWVRVPDMPAGVTDIGLRTQPNLELLDQMELDRILISPQFMALQPVLSRIAPTKVVPARSGNTAWQSILERTRRIARHVGHPEAGEALIERTRRQLNALRREIPEQSRPLLVVQFMDGAHVRVFGQDSFYAAVLRRLGLETAWQKPTNSWGFSLVPLARLAGNRGRLVIVDPIPVGVEPAKNGAWATLASVQRGDVVRLAPVWSFGALPAAQRFARLLSEAL